MKKIFYLFIITLLCAGCADKMSAPEHTDSSHFDTEDYRICGVLSSQVQWRILNSTMQSVYIDVTNNGIHSYYYLSHGDEVIIDACKEDTDESLMVENIKIYFDGKLCYLQDNGKVKVSKEFDIDNYDNWTNSTIKKNGKKYYVWKYEFRD